MRNYFQEGDLLVAEVQAVSSSETGMATLHARSLKYGKLRNGVFLAVSGAGGGSTGGTTAKGVSGASAGGRVVRSRRQVFTLNTGAQGGGDVDVILGVNGYCWLSKHVEEAGEKDGRTGSRINATVSISNLDDAVGAEIFSSQNDEISEATRREIARVSECIKILAEGGVQVDEASVTKAYESAVDWDMGKMEEEEGSGGGLGMTPEGRQRILEGATQ
jgi:exosome complex component RRP4